MGVTVKLFIIYIVMFSADIAATYYGRKTKNWLPFSILTFMMMLGIVMIGYLWATSSM